MTVTDAAPHIEEGDLVTIHPSHEYTWAGEPVVDGETGIVVSLSYSWGIRSETRPGERPLAIVRSLRTGHVFGGLLSDFTLVAKKPEEPDG